MRKFLSFAFLGILISACNLTNVAPGDTGSSLSQASSDSSVRETRNVMYTGVVQPAGISIYMEGTHRLVLPEGKFILLESSSLDLNGYVDETVNVFGSVRPTVEAGGMIMRVDRIELVASSSSESSEGSSDASSVSSSMDSSSLSAEQSTMSSARSSLSVTSALSSVSKASSVRSSSRSSISSLAATSTAATSAELEAKIDIMSRQDLESSQWSQQYCTSHIAFCAPVHRNWWFRSFGATNTELWRVEISSEPIEELNEGPIVLRLVTGSYGSDSGDVSMEGSQVIFRKNWTLDRHFEITADARLKDAVSYIGSHLTEYLEE